jgi:hypothetical protein
MSATRTPEFPSDDIIRSIMGWDEYTTVGPESRRLAHGVASHMATALREFTLLTDEGDDEARGVYIAKDGRVRCKGSLLAAIESARALLTDTTTEPKP